MAVIELLQSTLEKFCFTPNSLLQNMSQSTECLTFRTLLNNTMKMIFMTDFFFQIYPFAEESEAAIICFLENTGTKI